MLSTLSLMLFPFLKIGNLFLVLGAAVLYRLLSGCGVGASHCGGFLSACSRAQGLPPFAACRPSGWVEWVQ